MYIHTYINTSPLQIIPVELVELSEYFSLVIQVDPRSGICHVNSEDTDRVHPNLHNHTTATHGYQYWGVEFSHGFFPTSEMMWF
jgi:hypothetical protein